MDKSFEKYIKRDSIKIIDYYNYFKELWEKSDSYPFPIITATQKPKKKK